jgi:(S)-2-hydroxyglutarate dehydrogenase
MGDSPRYDVVVIGGGIVGVATAHALCERLRGSLAVLEAEDHLAAHQSGHNSGVIHSGLYYKPGSLKAKNCVEGRDLMYRLVEEHGVPFERCGKVVVATEARELPALDELERRGRANGLTGMRRLRSPEEIREYEPSVAGIAGLHVPQTGIVDYLRVIAVLAELVRGAGGEIVLGARVEGVRRSAGDIVLETRGGPITCRALVNCAGLQSDRVARLCGVRPGLQIVPFRGEYYELRAERRGLVRNLVYPVPDPAFPFLGVHFTRMIHGGVEAGPNAVLAWKREGYRHRDISVRDLAGMATYGGFWRMVGRFWKTGMGEMYRSLRKSAFVTALRRLVPDLRADDLEPGGAGVRAQAVEPSGLLVDDFRIVEAEGMVHVLNAPSPGATSSLSIGRTIADIAARRFGQRAAG